MVNDYHLGEFFTQPVLNKSIVSGVLFMLVRCFPPTWILFIPILILFCFSITFANASNEELFPTPEILKPNVQFWTNVYAKYSEREVIIHDNRRLDIVYEVINLDSLFRGVSVSSRMEWKKIEKIKDGYKQILLRLSRKANLDVNTLSGQEREVALLFKDDLNRNELHRAAYAIRGQIGLKERFKTGLERSGLYLNQMREIFRRENLPEELLALPHVESSFNYKAYSKFGAAGIWQFTRSTGRAYLRIDYSIDERLDPIEATEAAARLLKGNYESLGDWPLAITAYNHGRNGMRRAQRQHGSDIAEIVTSYRSRSFGFASRNFYAEFLAALDVATNYGKYFGYVQFHKSKEYMVFETPHYVTAKSLLEPLSISTEEFAEFNPALREPVLQSRRRIPKNTRIRIPYRDGLDLQTLYARISATDKFEEQVATGWHQVRSGESLSSIARRYRVSMQDLMTANNIRDAHRIYMGQNLQIPGERYRPVSTPVLPPDTEPTQLADASPVHGAEAITVVDAPSVPSFDINEEEIEPESEEPANEKLLLTRDNIRAVQIEANIKSDALPLQTTLDSIAILQTGTRHETVEDMMELALPEYYVQMTKYMGPRIVRAPKVEVAERTYREIKFPENGQIDIEPDETLGHIADWLGVSVRRLRQVNGLSYAAAIQIGQPIWLTFERVTPEAFHRKRIEYHEGIEEDFYSNFTVQGEKIRKVRRGDSIWKLCNQVYRIPYWLLMKHNPNTDLLNLSYGQEIVIPVVEPIYPNTTTADIDQD
jgi:membrane-bound lytic murein transglycosylase D